MNVALAGCVLFGEKRDIYLLHRNKSGFTQWELPGGKVEPGETLEQAAIRELREELGVEVTLKRKLGETSFSENSLEYIYTWFIAEVTEGALSICERGIFDNLKSFSIEELSGLKLSSNMKKLHDAVLRGEVVLF